MLPTGGRNELKGDCAAGCGGNASTPQTEAGNDGGVAIRCGALEVVQELSPLIDHIQQAATRRVIALVGAEMLTETIDACGQQCNLHFRRAGVLLVASILLDNSALLLARQ